MMTYGNLELILDTRAAADIWIEMHKTIREAKGLNATSFDGFPPDPLSLSERQLYEALTERFNSGLQSIG
jgi:hypothetical protein